MAASGQTAKITETVDAWTWSRDTGGYAPMTDVKKTVELLDAKSRVVRRDWYIKGGSLYNTSVWTRGTSDIPVKREVFDSTGRLQAKYEYKKEKNGLVEYMYRPDGSFFLLFYHKTDASGRPLELVTVDSSSNIMTRKAFYYDSDGRLATAVLRDGDRRPLLVSTYSYEPSASVPSAIVRTESIAYADTSAPKESVVRNVSNLAVPPAGPATEPPGWPEVSFDVFVTMTSNLARGSTPGAKVLGNALKKILDKTIIKGSCYDWINLVYTELGYTGTKRQTVWSGKETGPFADPLLLQPGDWIMFKNQTYGDIGHSGIFLGWLDFETRSAIVIGYAGQSRTMPGRFREYDISRLFGIVRGKD